jgi:hypothetical protein
MQVFVAQNEIEREARPTFLFTRRPREDHQEKRRGKERKKRKEEI